MTETSMTTDRDRLLSLYQTRFPFREFYPKLLNNIERYPEHHQADERFIYGIYREEAAGVSIGIKSVDGDMRVDLPVWYGDFSSASRYLVLGREPRDTANDFNVEKVGDMIFATPFALEKNGSRYYRVFSPFMKDRPSLFVFTDVVKDYYVEKATDKVHNDRLAKKHFRHKANEYLSFLKQEMGIVKPQTIFCLGVEASAFISEHFAQQYEVVGLRHPSRGGEAETRRQLDQYFLKG
jgi:hypothetical protein